MHEWWRVRLRALILGGMLAPAAALGQGADSLALTIEQNLKGIEFRLDLRPQQAIRDLEEQGRQLDLLERQAPDHPDLPELRQEFERLQARIPASAPDTAASRTTGSDALLSSTPSDALSADIEQVRTLQGQAEAGLLSGRLDAAAGYLEEAERQLGELEQRHADDIPAGHVPLIVVKEKIGALKEQLAQAKGS